MQKQKQFANPSATTEVSSSFHSHSTVKLDTRLEETAKVARRDEELSWDTETDMENDYE